jgi:hypothetical protein
MDSWNSRSMLHGRINLPVPRFGKIRIWSAHDTATRDGDRQAQTG